MSKDRFSKILVPIDGSKESMHAATLAIDIAKKYGAQVTAAHVVNPDQYLQALGIYRITYPDSVKNIIQDARREAEGWFAQIKQEANQSGVRAGVEVVDTPFSVVGGIVDYAERGQYDLIVIGTRGRSGFTKLLLGSVASGVITYATCPVMVAR
jgi:nucleotide-binding universal stress UspA family protein